MERESIRRDRRNHISHIHKRQLRRVGAVDIVSDVQPKARTVRTKVPEVEVHLFRRGHGPIDVFKSSLGGWDQDQLEVIDIHEKYGFKSIYAYNSRSGRGVPIRFNPKNGRSLLPYTDGSVIFIDGEPKDSFIKPITKILVGVAVITLLIVLVMKETHNGCKSSTSQVVASLHGS